ncbi:MAG: DegT/DnrJ/EryC1/StrS family aminotransferase [Bacteroidales bacterium]
MKPIAMVDLYSQYIAIKSEIDQAIQRVIDSSQFIKGPEVEAFENELAQYLDIPYVISCANGTDALMICLRAMGIQPGDEIIVPTFTFIATAEVIALLGATPVFADIYPETFNLDTRQLESLITQRTRAIMPVHLFGLCADMESIMQVAQKYSLYVIEDVAQALGATCTYHGKIYKAGTIGHMAATSFFPSKNLGCFGDGGAIFTRDETLARKARLIANHGAEKKYYHLTLGVNSRLDAIQAAILRVKFRYLDSYLIKRRKAASHYFNLLSDVNYIQLPNPSEYHTFNQYTVIVKDGLRDKLQNHLQQHKVPTAIYYPLPLHRQPAFRYLNYSEGSMPVAERLSQQVLSLPMHTELDENQIEYISKKVREFFQS